MAQQVFTSTALANAQVQTLADLYQLYQNKTDLWSWFEKMPQDRVNASGIKVPIETSPNPSFSYGLGNNGAFATPQAPIFDYYTVNYAFANAGSIQAYAAYLNRSLNTTTNMIQAVEASDAKQFASMLNRYASRGNGTMALATTSAAYVGGTPTIATCNGATDSIGTTHLVKGGYYYFFSPDGVTQRVGTVGAGAIQLASATGSVATFATNIPSDVVIGDIIVPQFGDAANASYGLYGLPIMNSSSLAYFGKSRTTTPGLASYEKTSAGALTASMLSETYFATAQRGGWFTGNGTTNLQDSLYLVSNTGNQQAYYALSLSSGAVVGSPMRFNSTNDSRPQLDIGFNTLNTTWFGAPIQVGNDIRGDELYFMSRKSVRRAILKDVGPISNGFPASEYLQSISSTGDYQTARIRFMDFWGQLFVPNPFRIGKISGITLVAPTQKAVNVPAA